MTPVVLVGLVLAGGLGAVVRFVVDGAVRARLGGEFPWATMLINVTGSLVLGVLTGLVLFRGGPSDLKAVLGTGFCGGYTTFSTASVETVRLIRRGSTALAIANMMGTAVLTVGAAALGLLLVR